MQNRQSVGRGQLIFLAIFALLFLVGDFIFSAVTFYTDWLWFTSLGYEDVFLVGLRARVIAFAIGFLAFLIPAVASIMLARAIMSRHRTVSIREEQGVAYIVQLGQDVPRRVVMWLALAAAVGLAILSGMTVSSQWEMWLKFLNAAGFGVTDPLFGQDVGFYFFTLPVYKFVQNWLFLSLAAILLLTAAVYLVGIFEGNIAVDPGIFTALRPSKVHIMTIAALAVAVMAFSYRIQLWDLVYSARPITAGAGFADVNARQTALWVLLGVVLITALLFLVSGFREGFGLPLWGVGAWVAVAVLLGAIYPTVVQRFQVEPNELQAERPYIEAGIRMTRQAFALDRIQEQEFTAGDAVTAEEVMSSPGTISNIRLWDHRLLRQTYSQIQTIRTYYDFEDVDVDRYTIDGDYRQVMLSARELSPEKLPSQAQNWVTRRLQFTHGYGLAMSPVNEVIGEGLPTFLIQDIPPQGQLDIQRPQIYYGEKDPGYAIVKTSLPEFDYPRGDDNVYTTYEADGGVKLDSFINRLAYSWYFREGNILFSGYLGPESSLLYVRDIQQRINKVAPFLMLDRDPYIVVADGQLWWIQDAYTSGTAYPYSALYQERTVATQAGQPGQQLQQVRTGRDFNYIRNSAKVVVNAYDGSVRYYLSEADDPLVNVYSSIFPDLFVPMDQLPPSLKSHIRYPEDLLKAQAEMFRTYHMQDPQVFYNREDLWVVSNETIAGNRQPIDPYFVIMRLPGENQEEFMEILPFSPADRDNMIAWLAARSDGENYGKLLVYKYPKDRLSFGPTQVEARINQDPVIASQFTLWSQAGSSVTRGNLLVIPVGRANLYIAPIYLQATANSIPELKRVIMSTGNRVVMEPTPSEALNKLFDGRVVISPSGQPAAPSQPAPPAGQPAPSGQPAPAPAQPGAPTTPPDVAALVRSAQDHYNRAQERLRAGDWAGYGEEMRQLEANLRSLSEQPQ